MQEALYEVQSHDKQNVSYPKVQEVAVVNEDIKVEFKNNDSSSDDSISDKQNTKSAHNSENRMNIDRVTEDVPKAM